MTDLHNKTNFWCSSVLKTVVDQLNCQLNDVHYFLSIVSFMRPQSGPYEVIQQAVFPLDDRLTYAL